ncbi:MAG: tetratricopeptide repeat protein [Fibrobacterota bacterium]
MMKHRQPRRFAALFLAALLLAACAGSGKKGDAPAPGKAAPKPAGRDTSAAKARGNGINFMDSLKLEKESFDRLSSATKLLLQAVDNYIEVLPTQKRVSEVLMLKGHTFYNNKMYKSARASYEAVIQKYDKAPELPEAIKMTAQTYYEEKQFDAAKAWYMKLKDAAQSGEDKAEASVRLAESYYQLGEKYRAAGSSQQAIDQFSQVVIEFPTSKIADASQYNVSNLYSERKEWSNAILSYNKLIAAYPASQFVEPGFFQMAKAYEAMGNWSKAAITYVEIFKRFPASANVKDALYNAGLAYEKEENFPLAAKMFEKYAATWPTDKDAPDVLFRAGELYGKLEDWANVERINSMFGTRYGNDKNRVVMALCMTGIASYMQKKYGRAVEEFAKAIATGKSIGFENKVNAFYAAKAQFTIGEINQMLADSIALILPEPEYQSRLNRKIKYVDDAVMAYTRVSGYKLIEWTTRAIYRIGETYEQFGVAVYKRERPKNANVNKMIALEEGVAAVVEQYLVGKAMATHEQNVTFGIQYKYEDEWIGRSRQQLSKLPCLAANTYASLIKVVDGGIAPADAANPMKIIQQKLTLLQNVAPFQDKAITLYLKTLEMAAKYGVEDKYKLTASAEVTRMSYSVGNTYAEVVAVARDAPVPPNYDVYKTFFYKVNLLGEGLVEYENSAISALYKNIKIAEAYGIKDEWVQKSREKIAEVLFTRSFCYEILADEALRRPSVPAGANADETEEYRLQFEDLGYKLQDEAYNIYRDVLEKGKQGVTAGPFLDLSYVRIYANFPNEVGEKVERDTVMTLKSEKGWLTLEAPLPADWKEEAFVDSLWGGVKKGQKPDSVQLLGVTEPMTAVWGGRLNAGAFVFASDIAFRRTFSVQRSGDKARLQYAATGPVEIYLNGKPLAVDSLKAGQLWNRVRKLDPVPAERFKPGKNVLAVHVRNTILDAHGFFMEMTWTDKLSDLRPRLPSMAAPMTRAALKKIKFEYPKTSNFAYDAAHFELR